MIFDKLTGNFGEQKVLWNNEMDFCVGLATELSEGEFVEEAIYAKSTDCAMPNDFVIRKEREIILVLELIE
jgi:hypothetical protein